MTTIGAEGLATLLQGHFDLVGTVGDGRQLIEATREPRPHVIAADIATPVLSGLEALRRLKAASIDAKVVFLTMPADAQLATAALGYVLKLTAGEELVPAIHAALWGQQHVSPRIGGRTMQGGDDRAERPM